MMRLIIGAALLFAAAPVTAQPAAPALPPAAPADSAKYTLDTPLGMLMADPKMKAIVVADLGNDPTQHPQYELFKAMSLNQIAPQSNGAVDDQKLKKIAADLAAAQ